MRFIIQMAIREVRSSWLRLVFFFLCIAIGVGSIVAVRSVIRNFNQVITSDARAILGADIRIASNRPWSPEVLGEIERITASDVEARVEMTESDTMVRPVDPSNERALLVELKGIESPYPLYGAFQMSGGSKFDHSLLENNGVLFPVSVLERLEIRQGERVKIGEGEFRITGVIQKEPGASSSFRFGPTGIISRAALEKAGLAGFGSRTRRRILLKVPEDRVESLVKELRTALKDHFVRVRSYKESQENMEQQFTRAEDFLSLTGLIILVLGGVGVSSVTRVFIEQKRKSIAVLKCVGATGWKVTIVYLAQILALGMAGSLVGLVLARVALHMIRISYAQNLPDGMQYGLQQGAMFQGFAFGLLVTLFFSILPLLRIRHIKPNVLLREETEMYLTPSRRSRGRAAILSKGRLKQVDWMRWLAAGFVLIGIILLSSWHAGSIRIGMFFLFGLVGAVVLLNLAAALLVFLLRRSRPFAAFSIRHAISNLYRPGNQTQVTILAVGLGAFFIIATYSIQSNLLAELDLENRANLPNMYLIDIQKDQKEGVEEMIRASAPEKPQVIPTVRARIAAINGVTLDPESPEYKKDRRRLGFEYTITYRSYLEDTESVVEGKFWDRTPSSEPEISIEESLQGMMGLDVGGTITFDILGRKITAKVTSIRQVDWKNVRTGFYVLFRPGVLEQAPVVYIAALDAPPGEPERSRFQRKLVDRYPNVTAIDVVDIVRGIRKILNTITVAVSFIGGFVLLSGILILVGSIAMTKFQRTYEAALLKTLGARRSIVLRILTLEYALLGTVAGIVGSLAAVALSYAVSEHVFELNWHLLPHIYLIGTTATMGLVILVGAVFSIGVLNRKPLPVLRTQ